jgi:hypothetical protein
MTPTHSLRYLTTSFFAVAYFKSVAAGVLKENGVVTGLIIHRSFDVPGARARCEFRNPVHVCRALSPESYPVLIANVSGRFCDAEKLSDDAIRRLELQPSFNRHSARKSQGWEYCLVKRSHLGKSGHSQVNVIEASSHWSLTHLQHRSPFLLV